MPEVGTNMVLGRYLLFGHLAPDRKITLLDFLMGLLSIVPLPGL